MVPLSRKGERSGLVLAKLVVVIETTRWIGAIGSLAPGAALDAHSDMSSMPISRSLLLYSPHRAVFLTTRPRARRAQQRKTPRFRGVWASPLPDSNRRPPPYHGDPGE